MQQRIIKLDVGLRKVGTAMAEGKRYSVTLDDDPMVHKIIQRATHVVSLPYSSVDGLLSQINRMQPIACFVDVHLADQTSGLDVIPQARQWWPYTPILVMTASDDQNVLSHALGLGANDFLRKPLDPIEIRTRYQVRAMELEEKKNQNLFYFDDLTLDVSHKMLSSTEATLPLSPMSVELLGTLMQAKGTLVDRNFLRNRLWGKSRVSENNLDRQVSSLRKSLHDSKSRVMIKSERKRGLYLSIEGA